MAARVCFVWAKLSHQEPILVTIFFLRIHTSIVHFISEVDYTSPLQKATSETSVSHQVFF